MFPHHLYALVPHRLLDLFLPVSTMPRTGRPPVHALPGRGVHAPVPAVVVRFIVRVVDVMGSTRRDFEAYRTLRTVLRIPPSMQRASATDFLNWLQQTVKDEVEADFSQFGEYDGDGQPFLYVDANGDADVDVFGYQKVMTNDDIFRTLARGRGADRSTVMRRRADFYRRMRAYGYGEDGVHTHRSFRYHIEGVSVKTLRELIPPELEMQHYGGICNDRMCVYRMLRDRNPPQGSRQYVEFDPENVRRWIHDHVDPSIETLQDGLSPEHVQAHAKEFHYPHAALDITRGIVCLHIPTRQERSKHYKTIAYTIIGNHVIPFSDPPAIESLMNSASQRMGRRRFTSYANVHPQDAPTAPRTQSCHASRNAGSVIGGGSETMDSIRKRSRSLDTLFRVDTYVPTTQSREQEWSDNLPLGVDIEFDDRVETFCGTDRGDQLPVPSPASVSPPSSHRHRGTASMEYPMAQDDDRFHYFTKAEGKEFIRERLRPSFQMGDLTQHIHYFVCTDEPNIEFLYEYCIHVLAWDPTTTARSYNGHCHSLRIKNVIWVACPDVDILRRLHSHLHPTEPMRLTGLATYAWRMLFQEMGRVGRYGTNLWDCMSQYPPNLQRLLDNHHPYHRPMLLTRTYHPPYGTPYNRSSEDALYANAPKVPIARMPQSPSPLTDRETEEVTMTIPDAPVLMVPELIPMEERHRVDLIRSYTATILRMAEDRDEYPIHDLTNQLVPFRPDVHTAPPNPTLPIGHYLVDLPTKAQRAARGNIELWERLPCFAADGEPRMMSHRMVKALLDRGLIELSDIRLMCASSASRQRRFGAALVTALVNMVHRVYQTEVLQDVQDRTVKSLINQLIGLCNGTSLPYTGNRFVFRNLEEAYQLMLKVYTEDQLTRVKLCRCEGMDPYWDNREFFYYELSTGGFTNKPFHLQPVYNMVLEDQAIRMFDLTRNIPLFNLIQIKIDAVEYRVRTVDRTQPWVRTLEADRVDASDVRSNRDWLEKGYIGRYKAETVKGPAKWHVYHQKEHPMTLNATRLTRFYQEKEEGGLYQVPDPEELEYVPDWKAQLKVVRPLDRVRLPGWATDYWVDWFQEHREDAVGVILTGPAGTGKTYCLRACYDTAVRLGYRVVRTSFTHAACVQLGFDAVTLSHLFGLDARNDHRSTMVLSRSFAAHLRSMHLDILMVDEISMLPLDILECLTMFHQASTQTRIILSGDFNQLPPVESYQFDTYQSTTTDLNYFDHTDVFPYLVYDRVRNLPGDWMQMTECMRTDDPLLQAICLDPNYVVTRLDPQQFPVRANVPMWRFLCHTNLTRKACNWYCMVRWLQAHPDAKQYAFDLRAEYIRHHQSMSGGRRFDATYYASQYDGMMVSLYRKRTPTNRDSAHVTSVPDSEVVKSRYVPRHWQYLQNFVYAEGMEVISRNTLQSKSQQRNVVNNRRAILQEIDEEQYTVTVQWMDVLQRQQQRRQLRRTTHRQGDDLVDLVEANETDSDADDEPLCLSFYDFAFNFVPGFCTTCHLAQGETIREHYGILDWNTIKKDVKMAYVAVTRASHPDYLHICTNHFTDPWESRGTCDVTTNVVRKLYHLLKTDYTKQLPHEYLPLTLHTDWIQDFQSHSTGSSNSPDASDVRCDLCRMPIKWQRYMDNELTQFQFAVRYPFTSLLDTSVSLPQQWSSLGDHVPLHHRVLRCVCKACHLAALDQSAFIPIPIAP